MKIKKSITCILQLFYISRIISAEKPKIAIIGSGIGGSSCAYFLRAYFNFSVEIDVYEANTIGGRLATVEYEGSLFEVGGSVIHGRNRYMKYFKETLKLNESTPHDPDSTIVILDENGIEFQSSKWKIGTLWKMLWRYNLSLFRLNGFINKILDDFDRIYELQEQGKSFTTVEELLFEANPKLLSYISISSEVGLTEFAKINKLMLHDLVRGSLRVNYGQSTNVHTFVGSVSVAGMFGSLWSVVGGNKNIPERLLTSSYINFIQRLVTKIEFNKKNNSYIVESIDTSMNTLTQVYDIVILANPITSDTKTPIKFVNFPKPIEVKGKYHRTVATIIAGHLNTKYFGISGNGVPNLIINNNVKDIVNSVGQINPCTSLKNHSSDVWKIFSQRPLTESEMNGMFLNRRSSKVVDWLAYPHYEDLHLHRSFVLHDRLYYINAIEWAASAMEMSVIGARNVALLVKHELEKGNLFTNMKANADVNNSKVELYYSKVEL